MKTDNDLLERLRAVLRDPTTNDPAAVKLIGDLFEMALMAEVRRRRQTGGSRTITLDEIGPDIFAGLFDQTRPNA